MTTITLASTVQHFEQILALQRRNHVDTVSAEVQAAEGFVFAEHTVAVLQRMAALSPQAIALVDGRVVGYCLSLHVSLRAHVPSLAPMFEQFGKCAYRTKPLPAWRYIVGGQVCVDRDHRGKGLLSRLYEQVRQSVDGAYDACVTEIATRNVVSLRAHQRLGFEAISRYSDSREDWVIVAWDLGRPAFG